jgi:elongation factor G
MEDFEAGTLGEEDLIPALHNAIREDKIFQSFQFGPGQHRRDRIMDFIIDYLRPVGARVSAGAYEESDAPKRHESDEEPVSLYVFRLSDAFAGRIYSKFFRDIEGERRF